MLQQHQVLKAEHHEASLNWSRAKLAAEAQSDALEKLQSTHTDQTERLEHLQAELINKQTEEVECKAEMKILKAHLAGLKEQNDEVFVCALIYLHRLYCVS